MKPVAALLLEALRDPEVRAELRAIAAEMSATHAPVPIKSAARLVDRKQCAFELGISVAALDRLRGEPGFPGLAIGQAPRFDVERVVAWLGSRGDRGKLRVVEGCAP